MPRLVLLRHGQSQWNLENRFSGWADVDVTAQGLREAFAAGHLLSQEGYVFDLAHTSVLRRAVRTLWGVLDAMGRMDLPVHTDWRLNERHYGALTGLNKAETAAKHGAAQVKQWRRSYDVAPLALERAANQAVTDPRYAKLTPSQIPDTECLKDTVARVLPYWYQVLAPALSAGQRVLLVAHGNSIRALVKHLEGISDKAITELNIPNGVPLVYEFDAQFKVLNHRYLGNPEAIAVKMAEVASQGQTESEPSPSA